MIQFDELRKRRGIVDISIPFLEKYPEVITQITGKMLIYRAEIKDYCEIMTYYGFSELFEECDNRSIPPSYLAEVHSDGGNVEFRGFKKVNAS